jgi:hypothetical protein
MQADIAHLQSKLAKIEGANNFGEKLLEIVNAKQIAQAAAPQAETPEKTESAGDKQDSEKGADSSSS